MELALTRLILEARSGLVAAAHRAHARDDGEGVISAAIAVLIMAFLGAAMWLAFKALFDNAAQTTADTVDKIGS